MDGSRLALCTHIRVLFPLAVCRPPLPVGLTDCSVFPEVEYLGPENHCYHFTTCGQYYGKRVQFSMSLRKQETTRYPQAIRDRILLQNNEATRAQPAFPAVLLKYGSCKCTL
ncbi:hypothetical protein BDQ94DRAFT_143407 [Aspergillus welwitschiae]|uniref:Uncharacterized protein n=1 Tax=Aspergillus welwitschiae TaxID=1341132 RepID=A0A3F3Q302_9EURO|nr:hypothetical protein BDQ94DRAFT_143407 [Aspergillus welwitschiae]RDH33604.1 hypothetical protein BDQ94DRAFT_143407 [Aspergillus welwitschiae]